VIPAPVAHNYRAEEFGRLFGAPRQKPGFPLQVLGFAHANPVGFPLQSLARARRLSLARNPEYDYKEKFTAKSKTGEDGQDRRRARAKK
jgi:hypothetical protein